MTSHDLFTLALTVLVAILGFLVKRQFDSYDNKHRDHYLHAVNMAMHETDRERESVRASYRNDRNEIAAELVRHMESDDKRFDRMEDKIDNIAGDIKSILKAVGK